MADNLKQVWKGRRKNKGCFPWNEMTLYKLNKYLQSRNILRFKIYIYIYIVKEREREI